MTNIIPIPSELLIHEVSYSEPVSNNGYAGSYSQPITVSKVRVEWERERKDIHDEKRAVCNAILFMDAINTPSIFEMKINAKVSFNGIEMVVTKVIPVYEKNSFHHYEVELV